MWWGSGADPGEEPPPPEEGLKSQFQQQQEQISQLKEMLKQNEQKLDREKVEQYATKLSDIKSRSKASKHKTGTRKRDSPGSPVQVQDPETPKEGNQKEEVSTPGKSSTEKMPKGNLVLLRKNLEESRLKCEQRSKGINESKKGIEEMVQHLKIQLDERDIIIQELQRGIEAHQSPAKLAVSQEMKECVIISGDSSNQTPQDMNMQLVYRDSKIIELNNKVAELETTILDLQENFREKDSVIDARTKAITLMSEDFSRRNKITLDNLEETREEMRKMQNNFVSQEVKMKEEHEQLKKELATKDHRLLQMEESVKSLESVRFDLSTRNAELQEKVVRIQEQNVELQKREVEAKKDPSEEHDKTRVEELVRQRDDFNKQIMKLKAQHRNKVKNLNKQLDGLKKMSDANEEIVKLQNKVAELEEDKGNLQLHLVDFDELKVSESHWQTRVSELEERVSQQSQDLDSHVHMITLLEAEKLDHMQGVQAEKEKVSNLELEVESLKTSLLELKNQKVSLEMKTVDLEEQVDILTKEKMELHEEMEAISRLTQDAEGLSTELHTATKRESDSDANSLFQSLEVVEKQEEKQVLETEAAESPNLNKSLDQLKTELLNSNRQIEEQREIIMDLKSKIESRDEELEIQNEIIAKLEHLGGYDSDRDDRIAEIVKELGEVAGDLEEWKMRCTEVEKRLQDLAEEKTELEERFKEVKSENSTLNQRLSEQREVSADLAAKLREQSSDIAGRNERISSLQSLIEVNGQTLEAREVTLKDVIEKLNSVEKQYESRHSELKQTLALKEKELLDMTSALANQEDILHDKTRQIMKLGETLQKQNQEFDSLQQHLSTVEVNVSRQFHAQLDEMSRILAEKDQFNSQLSQECQQYRQQVETLGAQLSDRVQYIEKLETQTEKLKGLELQLESAVSNLKSHEEEVSTLKRDLALKHSEVEEKMDKLKQVEGRVTELTEKNKKFIANLKAKVIAIKGLEQKIQQYETVVQAKERLISELTAQNEKLLEHQSVEGSVSNVEQQLDTVDMLTKELNEERSRTELIGDELAKATEKIISLETELKVSEAKITEMALIEESHMALTNKVSELEREISLIQIDLRNKDDQIVLLEEDKIRLIEEGKAKEQEEAKKSSELEDIIKELETEKSELLERLLKYEESAAKISELVEDIRSREQMVTELQEQLSSSSERNHQSLSAIEAKLQEREAVVDSLEQELSKATERIQHLEEGLAFVEERRQSLENKAQTLNMRLQESDKVKEEVVENEEMLEQRLEALIASEGSLKKKLEVVNIENEESTQKIAELAAENLDLRKEVVNMEGAVKGLQKELERLSPFEYSFTQASEKIETLEAELKRVAIELEHRMKERVQEMQRHAENLESDLKNMNVQLDQLELERRTLMERHEKLNDEKINLEDEIEGLNQTVAVYKQEKLDLKKELDEKLSEFEATFSEREMAKKELEEKAQSLESELQEKISALAEKEYVSTEMNGKIQFLEEELKMVSSTVDTAISEKEEVKKKLNERINSLEKELEGMVSSFESASLEKEKLQSELQERIKLQETELKRYQNIVEANITQLPSETDSSLSKIDSQEHIASLNAELDHLKSTLMLKENEIKSYQTRLLQLQFGTVPDNGHDSQSYLQDKISHLEDSNIKLQETVRAKEAQVSDLSEAIAASNAELGQVRPELESYQGRVEELIKQVNIFQEEVMNKDNYIRQLQLTLDETQSPQLDSMTRDYESKLFSLEKQKDELFAELLKTKAQQEVTDIVKAAEEHVQNMNLVSEGSNIRGKSVTFQEAAVEHSVSAERMEMEDQIKVLEEELQFVRTERDEALLKIGELSSTIPQVIDDTVLIIDEGGADMSRIKDRTEADEPWQQMSQEEGDLEKLDPSPDKDNLTGAVQHERPLTVPETILNFGSSWDVVIENEEEGWGWGSDEARLEEEHIQKQQQTLLHSEPSDVLNERLVALENHVKDLEVEKEKLSEELHAAQVRSGKMLKKLKDLKLKNDNLMKENIELAKKNDKNFGDLDQAIEEELKIRIDALEKELREARSERDTAYAEKEGLEGRVDILTGANERFVEMKERQDIDIEVWKQRNRDLSIQMQSLEWKIEELAEEKKSLMESDTTGEQGGKDSFFSWDKKGLTDNTEIQDQVAALSADNENLQGLLEQQRNLRLAAETELQEIQQRMLQAETDTQSCSEIERLVAENNSLKEQMEQWHVTIQGKMEELRQECDRFEKENSNLQIAYHALKAEYDRMYKEGDERVTESEKKFVMLEYDYSKRIDDVCNEKIRIEEQYRNMLTERDLLAQESQKLTANLAELTRRHEALKLEYDNIRECVTTQEKSLALTEGQRYGLECELAQLKSQTETNSSGLSDMSELLSEQQTRIIELERELRAKAEEIEMLRQLIESQKLEQARVEHEWNTRGERVRKELESSLEDLLKQQDRYSSLMKQYEELRDRGDEMIRYHVQEAVSSKEQEIENVEAQLMEKEAAFVLQNDILSVKEKDFEHLKTRLAEKDVEIEEMYSIKDKDSQNLKIMMSENERKFEELLGQKDQDIYNLQVQLFEKDTRINELQQTLDEEARQLSELRELLEDHELQLRQAKEELLLMRSNEVQAEPVSPEQRHESFSGPLTDQNYSPVEETAQWKDSSSAESQQKELDLALYMLHQRDVRCDELVLELMQLLEERDTLQLRLSNALRVNEELRARTKTSATSSPVKTTDQTQPRDEAPQQIVAAVALPPSVIPAPNEPQEDLQVLANKLSQLHSVGYRRDVTLQDEREQRHSEQMRLLHQRGSGIVVDANYTLSRDVQSPSTVLLNWIWGRSTPRVMHI